MRLALQRTTFIFLWFNVTLLSSVLLFKQTTPIDSTMRAILAAHMILVPLVYWSHYTLKDKSEKVNDILDPDNYDKAEGQWKK